MACILFVFTVHRHSCSSFYLFFYLFPFWLRDAMKCSFIWVDILNLRLLKKNLWWYTRPLLFNNWNIWTCLWHNEEFVLPEIINKCNTSTMCAVLSNICEIYVLNEDNFFLLTVIWSPHLLTALSNVSSAVYKRAPVSWGEINTVIFIEVIKHSKNNNNLKIAKHQWYLLKLHSLFIRNYVCVQDNNYVCVQECSCWFMAWCNVTLVWHLKLTQDELIHINSIKLLIFMSEYE